MSSKLKVTLGVLLVIAGFLVVRLGLYFNKSVKTAALISQTATTPAPEENWLTKDSDGDGLSDRDEIIYATDPYNKDTDGDGYIDGEEIATGYDPLDPFEERSSGLKGIPLVPGVAANLTDRLLNLGIASLINNSGEMDPEQMTEKKFADILQSVNNEALLSFGAVPLTDSDVKIIDDNSLSSVKKYLNTITQIIEEGIFSYATGEISNDINSILGMSNEQNYYEQKYNALKIIEVPSSWKEIHKGTLANLRSLANSTRALTDSGVEEDPVKASFALTQVQQSFLALHDLLNKASRLAKSQNIPLQDSILDMLRIKDYSR